MSVNLLTACTAIRKNAGVVLVLFVFVCVAFGWTLLWAVAISGASNQIIPTKEVEAVATQSAANYGYLSLFLLSYFYTHQVIQYTTHMTVTGTVGAWWFSPTDGSSCCSAGMLDSMVRALTTSFGSICFGSLLVALVQALKALVDGARKGHSQILVCIADCIIGCIER